MITSRSTMESRSREQKHLEKQHLYDNTAATTTLFEARTGTLKLNTIKRHNDEDTNRRYVIIQMKT